MSLMGIDMGTTGCKAGIFSADGNCLASAYREYHILHKQEGWAELDAREVVACAKSVIRETASAARSNDPVTALSISSMGEAMTPVSRQGEILGASILSSDVRGGDLLNATLKGMSQSDFYQINPNIPGVNYSLPKLLWIKKNEPDLYKQADYFLLWADLIAFLLGCDPVTSYSLANRTLLFDICREDWSDKLLTLAGIDRAKLPPPRPSGTVIGTVSSKAAAEFGLSKGTSVVLGGHDQCCNALGAGAIEAGSAVCGIGSYECITPVYDHIPDKNYMLKCGLNVEHHLVAGRYVSFLYNQAGLLVKWFRDTFAAADQRLCKAGENIYEKLTAEMPAGPTRLLVLPYFDITGPPEYVANASGVIAGLKTSTQRGEILKAIMECETFYFGDSLKALEKIGIKVSKLTATGGGARSDQWLQIKADILGIPIIRPVTTEAGVLGAAILAGGATKIFTLAEGIRQFVLSDRAFEPNMEHNRIYQERFAMYRKFFPTLRSFLAELADGQAR
ncbi:MAG: FGGY-family carbohydrate kinase [Kiritimatiellia bacterium]|nr:FGGY-family carbohydrate kinase [Kiritimatiellia bacterium]